MSTANERASRVRGRLSERANGIRSGLAVRRQSIAQGLIRDISQIVEPERAQPVLRREQAKGAIPAARGVSQRNYQAGTDSSSGIASPLQEQDFSAREWWPLGIPSTDGLLYFPAEKKVTMTDANGAQVVLEYAEP